MATLAASPHRPPGAAPAEGFDAADFEIFDIPGFAERMAALRSRIKPKLNAIGAEAVLPLAAVLDEPLFPHVAQHLRRSVNPPVATWVAFARSNRAYKPHVHLRCAVMRQGVRVTVFVEDYADDKLLFADGLQRNAKPLARYLARTPEIQAFTLLDKNERPLRGKALNEAALLNMAEQLHRLKGRHAVFGIEFAAESPVVACGETVLESLLSAAETLKPLYDCGRSGFKFKRKTLAVSREVAKP